MSMNLFDEGCQRVGSAGATHISQLRSLVILDLCKQYYNADSNNILDEGIAAIGKLAFLQEVNLSKYVSKAVENSITSAGLQHMLWPSVKILDLSRNPMGPDASHLGCLSTL